jgi:SAM-dependent methyltransferase
MNKIKIKLFLVFTTLKKIFAYNRFRREKWVFEKSKSVVNGSVILDVGAGSSPFKNNFNHCDYYSHDFIQLTDMQIQDGEGYSQIDFVSDILNIPVKDSFADVILCTEVIEHVKYPIAVIQEFQRILKPGGKLFITAPLLSGLHQEPFHFYGGYTKYWYQEILKENGFDLIEIKENGDLFLSFLSFGLTIYKFFIEKFLSEKNFISKILNLFVLLIGFIPFLILLPSFSWVFSLTTNSKEYTAGYHVYAVKL